MRRILWLILGHCALLTGFIGIFLPILPTTPFVLLAAYCYSKGSSHFESWLVGHPVFGPTILEWRQQGIIPIRAKIFASLMMGISMFYVFGKPSIPLVGKVSMLLIFTGILGYILSRPSRPC